MQENFCGGFLALFLPPGVVVPDALDPRVPLLAMSFMDTSPEASEVLRLDGGVVSFVASRPRAGVVGSALCPGTSR